MPLTHRMFTLYHLGRGGGGGTVFIVSNKICLILFSPFPLPLPQGLCNVVITPPFPLAVNFLEFSLSTMLYSELSCLFHSASFESVFFSRRVHI